MIFTMKSFSKIFLKSYQRSKLLQLQLSCLELPCSFSLEEILVLSLPLRTSLCDAVANCCALCYQYFLEAPTFRESENMDTSYYHVCDPLENFNLKVIVRESSRSITGQELSIGEASFYEDVNISWQEKRDGPGDIVKNRSKSGLASTPQVMLSSLTLYFADRMKFLQHTVY